MEKGLSDATLNGATVVATTARDVALDPFGLVLNRNAPANGGREPPLDVWGWAQPKKLVLGALQSGFDAAVEGRCEHDGVLRHTCRVLAL